MKLWRLPKIEGLVLFWSLEFLPLWPTYIIALFHHVRWPFANLIKQFNLSIWTLFHLLWIKQRQNCFNVLGRQVIEQNLSSTKKKKKKQRFFKKHGTCTPADISLVETPNLLFSKKFFPRNTQQIFKIIKMHVSFFFSPTALRKQDNAFGARHPWNENPLFGSYLGGHLFQGHTTPQLLPPHKKTPKNKNKKQKTKAKNNKL